MKKLMIIATVILVVIFAVATADAGSTEIFIEKIYFGKKTANGEAVIAFVRKEYPISCGQSAEERVSVGLVSKNYWGRSVKGRYKWVDIGVGPEVGYKYTVIKGLSERQLEIYLCGRVYEMEGRDSSQGYEMTQEGLVAEAEVKGHYVNPFLRIVDTWGFKLGFETDIKSSRKSNCPEKNSSKKLTRSTVEVYGQWGTNEGIALRLIPRIFYNGPDGIMLGTHVQLRFPVIFITVGYMKLPGGDEYGNEGKYFGALGVEF